MKKDTKNYGLMSIRNRLLVFSLLATLIPLLGMGWLLNYMLHTTLTDKVEQQLIASSNIIEQELSLWLKERNYDLYIFSNSFVISENFTKYLNAKVDSKQENVSTPLYIRTIETYLTSVQAQFKDFSRLFVLNNDGTVVAASDTPDRDHPIHFPDDTARQISSTNYVKGEVYFDEGNEFPLMLMGIPLFSEEYDYQVGILAIEVRLHGILSLLNAVLSNTKPDSQVHGSLLRLRDGRYFLSTDSSADRMIPATISHNVLSLFDNLPSLQYFSNPQGVPVVGVLTSIRQFHWGLIIAQNYDEVYARATRSRNRNVLITCCLGLLTGLIAYYFARQITSPLIVLARGAQRVSNGDLDVRLAIQKNDELGFATRVFNEMVVELQQTQTKLEELATTDALTDLANRKQIMMQLRNQFKYYQRYRAEFSVLMIDVDHFKKINDTYGHLAGDAVLKQLAAIFLKSLRNVDSAGRYGGEEFLVIVTEPAGEKGRQAAERIRRAVNNYTFLYENSSIKVNISVGITTISQQDENEKSLISRADKALYQAKRNGRNQVVYLAGNTSSTIQIDKMISLLSPVEK
jgi:diguanylate cyclase (GGDEF)-like protein